ncbi:GNAT family N-acetyltransferase [Polaribacter glomeratus]|uniref:GNAT family N-acetyltransferase n=1 Tax=Polaribacter glomeratus TaxID=102 RepID=A0A2S7WZF8_9FLAO|nr:GNAT family N-acetyltransferase [Polaribacter glomeratus]PQJ82752.1 GNAT family N-acetyltransferase [Polaribacter glomeratus]TXD65296.1 N-acetyltransferase [Polaribacter glomeratus]
MIEIATTSDAETLTKIALKSKSFWGYSDEILERWVEDLTVSKKIIEEMIVYKFIFEDEIVGFYILNQPKEQSIELDFLFVVPNLVRKGIGNKLIQHVFEKVKKLGCTQIIVLADPNAVPFYEYKGFKIIDKKESVIDGRFLVLLQKDLAV